MFIAPVLNETISGNYDVVFAAVLGATAHQLELSVNGGVNWTVLDANIVTAPDVNGNIIWPWDTTTVDDVDGVQLRARSAAPSSTPYRVEVANDNPIGSWNMEEAAGNIQDFTVGDIDLVPIGAPTRQTAGLIASNPASVSLGFDGVDDYLRQDLPVTYKLGVLTQEFLVRIPAPLPMGNVVLVSLCPQGAQGDGRGINLLKLSSTHGAGAHALYLRKGSTAGAFFVDLVGPAAVADRTYHIVIVAGAGVMKMYVDGVLAASNVNADAIQWADFAGVHWPQPGQVFVGANRTDSFNFVGGERLADSGFTKMLMSDLVFYDGELAQARVEAHYAALAATSPGEWFYSDLFNISNIPPETVPPARKAWAFTLDGHIFYVIGSFSDATLLYDGTTGQWCRWMTEGYAYWNMHRGVMWRGRVLAADRINPVIWELDPSALLDQEALEIARAVTGFQPVRGDQSLRQGSLRMVARQQTGAAVDAAVTLRFSDDGGNTWSQPKTLLLSDATERLEFRSLGRLRKPGRIWEITDSGGLIRISGIDSQLEGG